MLPNENQTILIQVTDSLSFDFYDNFFPLYFIVHFLLIINFYYVKALRCYTCTATEDTEDQRCLTNPANLINGITNCNKKFCTSVKVEYMVSIKINCMPSKFNEIT